MAGVAMNLVEYLDLCPYYEGISEDNWECRLCPKQLQAASKRWVLVYTQSCGTWMSLWYLNFMYEFSLYSTHKCFRRLWLALYSVIYASSRFLGIYSNLSRVFIVHTNATPN